jgi:ADP-ribose pyrophosphatase YjhB (NUDIX family)
VVVIVYHATVPDGAEPASSTHEVLEAAYFGPEEIPWTSLAFPSTHQALQDWVASLRV